MELAKVTSKGQVTIPIEIRKKLGIKNGDKVLFIEESGRIYIMNSSMDALREAQQEFAGEAERLGLKNDEDVADAIQDTILSCYENLKSLKQNRYFKTWMIRILINKCKDMIQKKTPFHEEEYAAMEWAQVLETLDSKYRLVVLLYYMEGFSVREISDALDMKESTVKSRLHRGRKQIAEMYGYKVKEGRV